MKYFRWYYRIINKALLEKRSRKDGYYESHHVKPKCKGGKFEVLLTAREHFIVHLILTKIYPKDYQLTSAFNKMFQKSEGQERYMPMSYWYEYKRKKFSENHPMKNEEVKERHYLGMMRDLLSKNIGKHYEFGTCKICNVNLYSNKKLCSDECRSESSRRSARRTNCKYPKKKSKPKNICHICGTLHNGKYCCSPECFSEFIKIPDNEYSKSLKKSRKKYIEENPDKVNQAGKKAAAKVDQTAKGLKISNSKKGNGNGNPHSKEIRIYNQNEELIYVSPKNDSFQKFCEDKDLPFYKLRTSYYGDGKLIQSGELKGWKAIRIK